MEHYRITIRNPDLKMVELLRETAIENSMTLGECFNDAIGTWYEGLPDIALENDEAKNWAKSYHQ